MKTSFAGCLIRSIWNISLHDTCLTKWCRIIFYDQSRSNSEQTGFISNEKQRLVPLRLFLWCSCCRYLRGSLCRYCSCHSEWSWMWRRKVNCGYCDSSWSGLRWEHTFPSDDKERAHKKIYFTDILLLELPCTVYLHVYVVGAWNKKV